MAKSSLRGFNKPADNNSGKDNQKSGNMNDRVKDKMGSNMDEKSVDGADQARDFLKQNENKSEDELMGDLKNMINSGKEDGSFDKGMLDQFYNMAAPMMEGDQKNKLDEIVNMIKNDKL